jgi:hypothetical protein
MRVASGRVINGRVELTEAELPEGAAVTVLLWEDDETLEAEPAADEWSKEFLSTLGAWPEEIERPE